MQNIKRQAVALLAMATLASCANPAFEAWNATAVFGESREVFKDGGDFIYRFNFRGGTVNYRPDQGAQWIPAAGCRGSATYSAGPAPTSLPNGCLVYACARAEQIRLQSSRGETRSQVIGYTRSDGSGHAFIIYQKDGMPMAEDNSGARTAMPSPIGRSSAEALCLAELFQKRTQSTGSAPIRASFVGRY